MLVDGSSRSRRLAGALDRSRPVASDGAAARRHDPARGLRGSRRHRRERRHGAAREIHRGQHRAAFRVSKDLLIGDPAPNRHKQLRVELPATASIRQGRRRRSGTPLPRAGLSVAAVPAQIVHPGCLPPAGHLVRHRAWPLRITSTATASATTCSPRTGPTTTNASATRPMTSPRCSIPATMPSARCSPMDGTPATSATAASSSTAKSPRCSPNSKSPTRRLNPIITDGTWRSTPAPSLRPISCSANATTPGWKSRAGTARVSTPATGPPPPCARKKRAALDSQVCPPVRATAECKPSRLRSPRPGRWTYDLGQNIVGVVRLRVTAPAGTQITIRHAEMLNPDGTLYTANLRGALSRTPTSAGAAGGDLAAPLHFPRLPLRRTHRAAAKPAARRRHRRRAGERITHGGHLRVLGPAINQLVSNIEWGQRGNYLSVPTDCPQRDERLGWMGDARGLRAHRHRQCGRRGVFLQMARRCGRRPARRRRVHRRAPRARHKQGHARLGRCRRHLPVDNLSRPMATGASSNATSPP